ncbi:MAG: hypothetical protein LBO67_06595 [Spirochaetaceae bacterium]|jgi:hypothetical protein|nr:hypothetical protein [Spirochaetaceae bacterium]
MKKPRLLIAIFAALLIAQPVPLYATLESFKNTLENSESEAEKKTTEADASEKEKDPDSSSSSNSTLFELMGIIWQGINFTFTYGAYPYAEDGFIQRPKSIVDFESFDFNKKNYSFSAGVSAFHLGGIGAGSWVSLSGNIFKFFGPYLDAYIITDTEQVLGGGRAGLHFSLIQSNGYNLAWYAQWQGWGGALSRHAFVTGLETRVYPVKPLTIRLKAGFQLFSSLSLGELEGEIGVMVKAWEFFLGYRYWGIAEEHFSGSPWHGPSIGLRSYF